MGDAFRLCSSEIPDIDRVKMCMVRRQSELSLACRVYFRPAEPAASNRSLVSRAHAHKMRQSRRRDDSDG
jgi:hypothetical protein